MRDFADLSLTRSKPCLVAVVVFSSYLAISLTVFAQLQDDGPWTHSAKLGNARQGGYRNAAEDFQRAQGQ